MRWARYLFLEVKLEQAEPYLRKSVELNPDQSAAYYYLGLIAEGKGQDDEAITTFKDVLRRDPNYALAYEAMGRVLLKEQKFQEAKQALEKAVLLNPEFGQGALPTRDAVRPHGKAGGCEEGTCDRQRTERRGNKKGRNATANHVPIIDPLEASAVPQSEDWEPTRVAHLAVDQVAFAFQSLKSFERGHGSP